MFQEHKDIDAIISDFNMPLMTGLDLRLKIDENFSRCPPFIIISGNISQINISEHKDKFYSIIDKYKVYELIGDLLNEIEVKLYRSGKYL